MADSKVMVFHDEDGPGYRIKLHQEGQWPYVEGIDGKPVDLRVILPPGAKTMDDSYITDFKDNAFVAVTNTNKKVGFGMAWDPKVFRYMWLWQAFGGGAGFPWFKDCYQMGIEPWSSYPCSGLEAAINNKSTLKLKAGESMNSWITAVAYESEKDVSLINKDGTINFIK
jgi:hypothetical protein